MRYVLLDPGTVDTGFSGRYTPDARAHIDLLRRSAQPVREAVVPILRILDDPPAAPLSAFVRGAPLDTHGPAFAIEEARRLHRHTLALLGDRAPGTANGRGRRLSPSRPDLHPEGERVHPGADVRPGAAG